jgi:hypothetical protein
MAKPKDMQLKLSQVQPFVKEDKGSSLGGYLLARGEIKWILSTRFVQAEPDKGL